MKSILLPGKAAILPESASARYLCDTTAMPATTLMIQGTTSGAGKSALVAGLCRVLRRRGRRVVPFKPQNMALNSAVTIDGGEIGRAQAVQARAAGVAPHSDMNPVLIKPASDTTAQIIIHGKVATDMDAKEFHAYKPRALTAVMESHSRLAQTYEVIVAEGAGSPAEINLRDNDIANMGFAETVDCPVLLVADIDRGGVFAHLVGTLALLTPSERNRILGFIINRFRGDLSLLQPGIEWLENETGKPVLGVLPYLHGLHLEAEDALPEWDGVSDGNGEQLQVVVPVLQHISNHTDFDPLRLHPQVALHYVGPGEHIPAADLIILPGSKNVRNDLARLRSAGWGKIIARHLRYGGKLIGICGGFQMLGNWLHDPEGLEGAAGCSPGFGWLDMETTLETEKRLAQVQGRLVFNNARVSGYEIHMGTTRGPALARPLAQLADGHDGAVSEDGHILGTYLHGLFSEREACDAVLAWAGLNNVETPDYGELCEAGIDRLADAMEQHLDLDRLTPYLQPRQSLKQNSTLEIV